MKIEHVALNIPDPVKAGQWYAEHLGMRIVRSSNEPPYIHFIADSEGESVLEFYCNPAAKVPDYASMDPLILHIAFVVDDIAATRAKLVTAGATAVSETTAPNGDQLAMLRDPWGVPVQLVKRVKPLVG
jgi:catechol 2,3-dioxygenase-like lactoylglutathione lyase family enzyme